MKHNKFHYISKASTTVDETCQHVDAHPKQDRFFIPLKISLAQISGKYKAKSYLDNNLNTVWIITGYRNITEL